MNAVFLDTVGLIAVWDIADQWHLAAEAVYNELLAQGRAFITTEMVLCECGNSATRRPYRRRVSALRRALIEERLVIVPEIADIDEAWANFDRGEAGEAGIVDHLSFVVMRRLGLTEAFTNDRHFQAAGFTTMF
jgi:predicted nucleic acid-binding protein